MTGALSLQASLDHPGRYALTLIAYLVSFIILGPVLRGGVPLGKAHGTWGASGFALTAIFGSLIFGEPITALMVLVIAGILLVALSSHATVSVDAVNETLAAVPSPLDATERDA